jgi:hypothetical protein
MAMYTMFIILSEDEDSVTGATEEVAIVVGAHVIIVEVGVLLTVWYTVTVPVSVSLALVKVARPSFVL